MYSSCDQMKRSKFYIVVMAMVIKALACSEQLSQAKVSGIKYHFFKCTVCRIQGKCVLKLAGGRPFQPLKIRGAERGPKGSKPFLCDLHNVSGNRIRW